MAAYPSPMAWSGASSTRSDDLPANLVADVQGGTTQVELTPGRYFLHAMFGWAGATTELMVTPDHTSQTIVLNAGGLRLRALIGDDQPLPAGQVHFEVYGTDPAAGERVLITDTAGPDEILRLNAGRYNVVSYYGDINAVVRADIDVEAGQLTELALYHEAAQVTLKLVNHARWRGDCQHRVARFDPRWPSAFQQRGRVSKHGAGGGRLHRRRPTQ